MIVKILGMIDLAAALALLLIIFGLDVFTGYIIFCAGLLMLKGLFIFGGEPLSAIDLAACILLVISIFILPYSFMLWTFSMLLMAKGIVSFI